MANLSIFQGLLQPPKSVADYDQQAATTAGLQLQNTGRGIQNQTAALNNTKTQADLDRSNQLLALSKGLPQGSSDLDRLSALRNAGFYDQADALSTSLDNRSKSTAVAAKDTASAADTSFKTQQAKKTARIQAISQFSSPEDAKAHLAAGVAEGSLSMADATQMIQKVPTDPAQFKDWQISTLRALLTPEQQTKLTTPDANAVLSATTQTSNNTANNERSRLNNAATIAQAERSAVRTDSRVKANATAGGKPPAGYVWGEADEDGQRALVAIPGGPADPSRKQKDIPATVNTKIIEGQQGLSNIDAAIAAVRAQPSAFGLLNAVPGVERLRQGDTKGVDARAQVANIGSLKLHDRSGAAVSASEFPRLAPFIPSSSDNAGAIITKLTKMKEIAEGELGLYADTYGPESGYKPSPVLKRRAGAAPSAAGDIHAQADAILKGQ